MEVANPAAPARGREGTNDRPPTENQGVTCLLHGSPWKCLRDSPFSVVRNHDNVNNNNGKKENALNFTLRGESFAITSADILGATREISPNPVDGRNKYFVELHGRRFPIKQVLQLVSGLPLAGFTAQDAHRVLSRLGFDIVERPVAGRRTAAHVYAAPVPSSPSTISDAHQDEENMRKLLVVFETDADGWTLASCPSLPGCHSQGRTRAEALDNVREAMRGYLASLREHGAALPPSTEFQLIDIRV